MGRPIHLTPEENEMIAADEFFALIAVALVSFVVLTLVILHILAILGVGEGTPLTARSAAKQTIYSGDASWIAMALAACCAGAMIYFAIP